MILKGIMFAMCITVGLLGLAIIWFLGYSILWMIRERMDEMEGQQDYLEIPWGEDFGEEEDDWD